MATELTTSREVFDHHVRALGTGDLDALLTDYTEESVIIGPDGVLRGLAAIRGLFQTYLSGLLKPGTYDFSLDKLHIDGEIVFILWHADCCEANIAFASDTFVIRGGKIAVQTIAAKFEPRA